MQAPPLQAARRTARLSRETLAQRSGLSPRTIYNIEHGLAVPRRPTRIVLALALGRRQDEISWPTETRQEAA